MDVRLGDVFVVSTTGILAKLVLPVQRFWATDGDAKYNHGGVITDNEGTIIHALWRVQEDNLFERYSGRQVLIARPDAPEWAKSAAVKQLSRMHLDQRYPFWRLALHLIPPIAKYVSAGGRYVVCSELAAKYLHLVGTRHKQFTGATPDMLADEFREWRKYSIVYEGELP